MPQDGFQRLREISRGIVDVVVDDVPAGGDERIEIAERLRLFERAERVVGSRALASRWRLPP